MVRSAISTLLLITAAIIMMVVAWEDYAEASHNYPDTDGKIPVYHHCPQCKGYTAGRTEKKIIRHWNGKVEVQARIYLNDPLMDRLGAGRRDKRYNLRHEMAHAHGWDHYEGTPQQNAAYYPSFKLCYC